MGGGPIGYAVSTVDTLPSEIRVQDELTVDIEALGSVQRTQMVTEVHLSRGLVLRSFDATVTSPAGQFRAGGTVQGDSVLDIAIETGANRPQHTRVRLDRPIVLPSLLPLEMAVGQRLRVGSTYTVRLFDPLLMQEQPVEMRVLAESTLVVPDSARLDPASQQWVPARLDTVRAWKVAQRYGGVEVESWVDPQGRTVSETSPIGFRMQRTAFEIARDVVRTLRGSDGDGSSSVAGSWLFPQVLRLVEAYLDEPLLAAIDRLFSRPIKVMGHMRQRVRGNWKLYSENTRDPYHAALLHGFHATFGLYRTNQKRSGGSDKARAHSTGVTYGDDWRRAAA